MYDKNSTSVFYLHYHMVLVIKYRQQIIDDNINRDLKEIFINNANKNGVTLLDWNIDENKRDHVHIIIKTTPEVQLSNFIARFKISSSKIVRNKYPYIKDKLWKNTMWSRGYFISSLSQINEETIKNYVASQGQVTRQRGIDGKYKEHIYKY